MYTIHRSRCGCLIVDIYLDLCCRECKIQVMKDKVICLSHFISVRAIITAVIYTLPEATVDGQNIQCLGDIFHISVKC